MEYMTGKERMLCALTGGTPDRIPVAPDISNMIPCRLTGKSFWEIYVNQSPPLWRAYLDAVDHFGIDAWFIYGGLEFRDPQPVGVQSEILSRTPDRWTVRNTFQTPAGPLTELEICPVGDAPTFVEKRVKRFKEEFPKLRYLYQTPVSYDATLYREQARALGERGLMASCLITPGLQFYVDIFNGNLEAATYALYDEPELMEELRELDHRRIVKMAEMNVEAGVESILIGGSGSITMQGPELWRYFSLPTIRDVTALCRQAGIPVGLHSCGRQRYLVETVAAETGLDYVHPLEVPPMGDCILADVKEKTRGHLALMGNLHTTETMLFGSPDRVRLRSLECFRDAGEGGGFVLSTGDQCGRDTPEENLFAMVETAREYGSYPLDLEAISGEIARLDAKGQEA